MSPVGKPGADVSGVIPQVLVVDDEPAMIELMRDVVGSMECEVLTASSIAEARRLMAGEEIHLLVADVHLPDGDGTSLLKLLRRRHPTAAAIIMTGEPSVDAATLAIRQGAVDFVAKPFSATQIAGHVRKALNVRDRADRSEKKLVKLKSTVRRLSTARKTISQKVDILCNDLISAYGELSKQMEVVRTQEGFRKTIAASRDLEELICQAMDWLMRQTGYSNVAVWLTGDDSAYQLGAYMKYTIPGDDAVSDALLRVILPLAARDGRDVPIKLRTGDLVDRFSAKELQLFKDQEFLALDCTYLGESLAALVFFRDENIPFSEPDVDTLRAIGPLFASALATIVRQTGGGAEHDGEPTGPEDISGDSGGGTADPKRRKQNRPDPADWWKRGESSPF